MEQQSGKGEDKGTVAVIGGGVASIIEARLLQKTHQASLFEQGNHLPLSIMIVLTTVILTY